MHHDPLEAGHHVIRVDAPARSIEGLIGQPLDVVGYGAGQSHELPRRRPAHRLAGRIRTCHQERLHRRRVNGPEGDALGHVVERCTGVEHQLLHQMPARARQHERHLWVLIGERLQQAGEVRTEFGNGLELVEHKGGRSLRAERRQDRIDVGDQFVGSRSAEARAEEERRMAALVERDDRRHTETTEELRHGVTGTPPGASRQAVRFRRQLRRQCCQVGALEDVDSHDCSPRTGELGACTLEQRRLSVAPGGRDHHVDAVAHPAREGGELLFTSGEEIAARRCAVVEGVHCHRIKYTYLYNRYLHYTAWRYSHQHHPASSSMPRRYRTLNWRCYIGDGSRRGRTDRPNRPSG